MRKLFLCSLILVGFSCAEEAKELIPLDSEEVLLFKQSDFYAQALKLEFDIDFSSASQSESKSEDFIFLNTKTPEFRRNGKNCG